MYSKCTFFCSGRRWISKFTIRIFARFSSWPKIPIHELGKSTPLEISNVSTCVCLFKLVSLAFHCTIIVKIYDKYQKTIIYVTRHFIIIWLFWFPSASGWFVSTPVECFWNVAKEVMHFFGNTGQSLGTFRSVIADVGLHCPAHLSHLVFRADAIMWSIIEEWKGMPFKNTELR